MQIKIELTGPDWDATAAMKFYAQRDNGNYGFGPTEESALADLLHREKTYYAARIAA